jgi:preprotein translocase subunit SecG
MLNFLLNVSTETNEAQSGIPPFVWIIVAVIVAIVLLVLAIKSFWVSKGIATITSIGGIVFSIIALSQGTESLLTNTIICGVIFFITYVFVMGNMMFDSETEGDYLIAGSLVHDTNHPFTAFCEYMGGIAALTFFIFWAAYAWTFVIGLIAFILTLVLNVAMIVERIRG